MPFLTGLPACSEHNGNSHFLWFRLQKAFPRLLSTDNNKERKNSKMATADATRANGARYRNQNDRVSNHVPRHDTAPEWGGRFTCVACWQHNIVDIERHRSQHCPDWNALNRINNGYVRQFNSGMAPPGVLLPLVLTGEHYRMVKGRFGIQAHHIMRWQDENWGPYDQLQCPPNSRMGWENFTYDFLLMNTINSLPRSIALVPRPCTCTMALQRSRNGTTHSYHNEKNTCDEFYDQRAVGNFMEAHHPLRGAYQHMPGGAPWNTTQAFLSTGSNQPLNGMGHWVELAPPGMGICGLGNVGITDSNVQHFQQWQQNVAAGAPNQQANLYQGKTANDIRQGSFAMPGTPRR